MFFWIGPNAGIGFAQPTSKRLEIICRAARRNGEIAQADSARILFSRDPKDYPIVFTCCEGMECIKYSSLIYAYGEENIAVSGNGILDGNADNEN